MSPKLNRTTKDTSSVMEECYRGRLTTPTIPASITGLANNQWEEKMEKTVVQPSYPPNRLERSCPRSTAMKNQDDVFGSRRKARRSSADNGKNTSNGSSTQTLRHIKHRLRGRPQKKGGTASKPPTEKGRIRLRRVQRTSRRATLGSPRRCACTRSSACQACKRKA